MSFYGGCELLGYLGGGGGGLVKSFVICLTSIHPCNATVQLLSRILVTGSAGVCFREMYREEKYISFNVSIDINNGHNCILSGSCV